VFDSAAPFDLDQLRARLRQMDIRALKTFGEAAACMASPKATADGRPPRNVFRLQLEEARAEWRRRQPTNSHLP
jgi:hypothetical protein